MIYFSKNKKFKLYSFRDKADNFWVLEKKNPKKGFFHDEYVFVCNLDETEKGEAVFDLDLIPIWKVNE